MFDLKKAFDAAKVFNPFELKSMSLGTAHLHVDGLALFGFPEFSPKFLVSLKAELPELKKHAEKAFDWSTLPGAKEYDAGLARNQGEGQREGQGTGCCCCCCCCCWWGWRGQFLPCRHCLAVRK